MTKNLLIVESPAKAKTIEKILGSDFKVKSCFGHIRDLERGNKAIDTENQYIPKYIVPDEKKKVVNELKKEIKQTEAVWLATDEDREGEAISWHLCEVFGLDINTTKRIVFHEITKPAIQKAVQTPRNLDMDLVNAQQARRVLDRLVGFELSPILWRKVSRSQALSAGRVQSVAVRVVVEREKEIKAFEPEPYYKVVAFFDLVDADGNPVQMKGELGKRFDKEEDAVAFLTDCKAANFNIATLETKPAKKSPRAPFTTSTLQQEASVKLGFSVSRTMIVAQKLYEAGKITYMRTDSVNLSDTARAAAIQEIKTNFGDEYAEERKYKTKAKDAQEAHEAIRPTYFNELTAGAEGDEQKLYKLIWQRAIASQMSDAKLDRTTAKVAISTRAEQLVSKGEVLTFPGYLKVYNDTSKSDDSSGILPPLTVNQLLSLANMTATQRFTRPQARFTEAGLVKQLEELGIGRPSTYAPTIGTIQKRDYVVIEKREGTDRNYNVYTLANSEVSKVVETEKTGASGRRLFPTAMGMLVNDFLVENFGEVLNYSFTAKIEEDFDKIAQGSMQWNSMIDEFYKPFKVEVDRVMEEAERVTGERLLGVDPVSGKNVYARLGRFGPMVQIGETNTATNEEGKKLTAKELKELKKHEKEEDKPKFSKIRKPYALDTITLDQAMELFKLPRNLGEFEGKVVKAAEGRFGPYIQHDGKFASIKKDSGLDPLTITYDEAVELVLHKRAEDARKLIKVFEEDEDVRILEGRWGAYIKYKKQNVKIPKEKKEREIAATLTYEEVKKLIEDAPPPKKKGGRKTATKKKATTKAKK